MSFVSIINNMMCMYLIAYCTDEQYVLMRLANAIIDIYGMAAVVSR